MGLPFSLGYKLSRAQIKSNLFLFIMEPQINTQYIVCLYTFAEQFLSPLPSSYWGSSDAFSESSEIPST